MAYIFFRKFVHMCVVCGGALYLYQGCSAISTCAGVHFLRVSKLLAREHQGLANP